MPKFPMCRHPAAKHRDQEARRPVAIAVHHYDVEEAGFGIWIVRSAGVEKSLSVQPTRAEAIGMACAVAKDWSYEREWRLMFPHGLLDSVRPFRMPNPIGVYLGARIITESEASVREACELLGVPVWNMQHSARRFQIEIAR